MSNPSLVRTLTDVGLSENQSRIYLAALALGSASPTELASEAGVKRTTVYPVVESLQKLGLISEEVKGFKKRFAPESPDMLESLVEMRRDKLKRSLGDLSALYSLKTGESALKHYEGKESIKTVYNGLLSDVEDGDDYLIISSPDEWYSLDPDFFQDFILRRAKLDLKIRSLLLDSKLGRDYQKNKTPYNLQAKLFPPGIAFRANIVIIPKKVVIHQLQPPIWAIVIENRDIVRTHQELFELLWRMIPD